MSKDVEIDAYFVTARHGQHHHDPEDVAHQDLSDKPDKLGTEKSHFSSTFELFSIDLTCGSSVNYSGRSLRQGTLLEAADP